MGKGNRHKKNVKSERSKVKLKDKILPKGTNVTNTTFKVRKIIIGEQLKNVGENVASLPTQIKDCLSKLRHHNQKACVGALLNLKSILSKTSNSLIDHQFSSILKNLAHLITNEDRVVRRESLAVMSVLLEPISQEDPGNLTPYCDILASYLCCSMTHIDTRIQNDSLLFLDLLLKLVPSIIVNNCSRILDNFLDMISKLRSESRLDRSLTTNLNIHISTVRWRVKVLERLRDMLHVISDVKRSNETKKISGHFNEKDTSFCKFGDNKAVQLSIHNKDHLKIVELGLFSGTKHSDFSLTDDNLFNAKVETLMPLLFETWLEVKLSNTKDSLGCYVLDAESAILLMSIMDIMLSLQYLIQRHDHDNNNCFERFLKEYRKDFRTYIMDGFPYTQVVNRNNIDCLRQNLYICHMFLILNKEYDTKQKASYETILQYIGNCLRLNSSEFPKDTCDFLEDMLRYLFFRIAPKWNKDRLLFEPILESIVALSENEIDSNFRRNMFKILCEISQADKLKYLQGNTIYLKWLRNLPLMLCSPKITADEIAYLSVMARQNNEVFLNYVLHQLPNILETLSHSRDSQLVSSIVSVLYYIPKLTADEMNCIKGAIESCEISEADKYYVKTIFDRYFVE